MVFISLVFTATPKEAKEAMRKISGHGTAFVVKLRGLPYAVTEQQIEEFFSGKFPDPNPLSILICTRYQEKRQWLTACIICSHR